MQPVLLGPQQGRQDKLGAPVGLLFSLGSCTPWQLGMQDAQSTSVCTSTVWQWLGPPVERAIILTLQTLSALRTGLS